MATTKKTAAITFTMTTPATGAYPTLFTPRRYKDERGVETGEPKFSLRLLFKPDHPDLPGIRAKLMEAAKQEWPNADEAFLRSIQWPLQSGDALADKAKAKSKDQEHLRGFLVMNTTALEAYPPGLGVIRNGIAVDVPFLPVETRAAFSADFYGGMDCMVQLAFVAYEVGSNKPCVTPYINAVQSLAPQGARNPKLDAGGGKSASGAFGQSVKGFVSSIDPTAGSGGGVMP
jgi:hypothetical protein